MKRISLLFVLCLLFFSTPIQASEASNDYVVDDFVVNFEINIQNQSTRYVPDQPYVVSTVRYKTYQGSSFIGTMNIPGYGQYRGKFYYMGIKGGFYEYKGTLYQI